MNQKPTPEVYVSTDIETNGPIPGPNSMWSLGSAAFCADGSVESIFHSNLKDLPGSTDDPATLQFWRRQPAAFAAARKNARDPATVMREYVKWLDARSGKPVFVAYPAGFDFLFVYWYLMRFVGRSPFGFSALDIKTYASAVMRSNFRETVKKNFPRVWLPKDMPHTHCAVDDALEQGIIFHRMRNANLQDPVRAHQQTEQAVKSRS